MAAASFAMVLGDGGIGLVTHDDNTIEVFKAQPKPGTTALNLPACEPLTTI
jgi:hypothetical protein